MYKHFLEELTANLVWSPDQPVKWIFGRRLELEIKGLLTARENTFLSGQNTVKNQLTGDTRRIFKIPAVSSSSCGPASVGYNPTKNQRHLKKIRRAI